MTPPHQHRDACYGNVPETEGNGRYLRCEMVATPTAEMELREKIARTLWEHMRTKVFISSSKPSWENLPEDSRAAQLQNIDAILPLLAAEIRRARFLEASDWCMSQGMDKEKRITWQEARLAELRRGI